MTHTRKNAGTCSRSTTVVLSDDGVIREISVTDGCEANLQGLCALLTGRRATEAISLLEGIRCEEKPTSCPHQISLCLAEALDKLPH